MPETDTRQRILKAGLAIASRVGLQGITIGTLAGEVGLTKAGLYAHFDSKDAILLEILKTAVADFIAEGVEPALEEAPGVARLRALFDAWLEWSKAPPLPGGCVFISSATELDDRPGPLRDYLVRVQDEWAALLGREVKEARARGELRSDLDPRQFVFELYGAILSFHYYARLFEDRTAETRARWSFQELLARSGHVERSWRRSRSS
ncbi:MAG TPA: TetR/AcrR family transcriptional regulator [Gemmatimonadota bacterium]|nr:TetR/AcrR family transcriptional regulator [Gemmatimonadota bacterium]